jgi:hypothetical protein
MNCILFTPILHFIYCYYYYYYYGKEEALEKEKIRETDIVPINISFSVSLSNTTATHRILAGSSQHGSIAAGTASQFCRS